MAWIFDPDTLQEISRLGIGKPPEEMREVVIAALVERYPNQISPRARWVFNNAGGAMGQMLVLHGSLSEYILIFGTPIGTEGHSGRYRTEVFDFMMSGEMWCYIEGEMVRSVYRPGDTAYLGKGQVKGYRVPEHAWMLEYARGPIPTMLPFGLADSILSTLDATAIWRTVREYGGQTVKHLLRGKI